MLQAPPGAGKTTLVPLALLSRASWLKAGQRIVMLEPRRLAAKAAARRMAAALGEKVGGRIGYSVRFESVTSADTRVEVVTEGLLARASRAALSSLSPVRVPVIPAASEPAPPRRCAGCRRIRRCRASALCSWTSSMSAPWMRTCA